MPFTLNPFTGKLDYYYLRRDVLTYSAAGIVTMPMQSGCSVWLFTSLAIGMGVWTRVPFDREEWDIHNEFDSAINYQFTATEAGIYACKACVLFAVNADQDRILIQVRRNGIAIKRVDFRASSANSQSLVLSCDLQLAAGDTVDLWGINATGNDTMMGATREAAWMMIAKIA